MTAMQFTLPPRDQLRIVLLEGIHASASETLQAAGYTRIETHKGALSGAALREALAGAHVLGIRSRTQLTAEVLQAADDLQVVGAFCIGTNQIDLDAARRRGVPVFNAPFSNTRSVAELVVAEVVMLVRGIPQKNALLHRGGWTKSAAGSHEVRGKTLGIVGYGHIGTQVGVLAEHLGMRVVFHDIEARLPLGNARQVGSLDELLALSHVVTLHVPETPETAGMVGAAQLARMQPGSHLINASRGTVVDIEALAQALRDGRLGGAAIDVFPVEPASNDDPFTSALVGLDNALLTPHIGGSTAEAQENIGREVAAKLARWCDQGATLSAVNFPEVSLPPHRGARLLHIHRNLPGMLAAVNERLSSAGLNIAGQTLQTRDDVGYVVTDVEGTLQDASAAALCDIPGTIRCRVLG